mmetsp:Transcript_1651/g.3618  ORF Transcript_1651/g.3618 Transcript_1651/m.3618 type:complete len:257 (+) Transcript_1651:11-781(+)
MYFRTGRRVARFSLLLLESTSPPHAVAVSQHELKFVALDGPLLDVITNGSLARNLQATSLGAGDPFGLASERILVTILPVVIFAQGNLFLQVPDGAVVDEQDGLALVGEVPARPLSGQCDLSLEHTDARGLQEIFQTESVNALPSPHDGPGIAARSGGLRRLLDGGFGVRFGLFALMSRVVGVLLQSHLNVRLSLSEPDDLVNLASQGLGRSHLRCGRSDGAGRGVQGLECELHDTRGLSFFCQSEVLLLERPHGG